MKLQKPPSELREAVDALRPRLMRAAFFSLLASLLVLAPSGYMLEVYSLAVTSRSQTTLGMLTLAVVGAYVVMEVLEWVRAEEMRAAGVELDRRLSSRVFRAIFDANLARRPGVGAQPVNDLRTLREFLATPVLPALVEVPAAALFLVLISLIHPWLGVMTIVGALVQTLLAWATQRATQERLLQANRSAIAAQQYADGTLRNAEVIEAMGMLKDIHRRWIEKQRDFLALQASASDAAGGFQAATKLIQQLITSGLLGLGCWLTVIGELGADGAMMIVASILGGRVLSPVVQVVTQWRTVANARDAWQRLDGLLTASPRRAPAMPLPPPKGRLTVEGVTAVAPGSNAPILRGVQFALQPGQAVAVIGPSAAGKTTLARLLIGAWPAAMGKVRLDGVDVFAWDKTELGPHVGYLPQGVELFDGTLAENIARFGPIDRGRVEEAARLVGLHEFITALPQGYDSPVGRDGTRLSGGQRQRVGLARALYGNPVFVVLDEPNSSLDEEGDSALAAAIEALKRQGTAFVVITHRTAILGVADSILLLHDGAQQAFGPRDEVLSALQNAAQKAAQPARAPRPPAGPALSAAPAPPRA